MELAGNFSIIKSNKITQFLNGEELQKISDKVLSYAQNEEQTNFAFSIIKDGDSYELSHDLTQSLKENAFLCYFDPSPLLPS